MMIRVPDIDSKFTLHKRQAAKTTDTHPRTFGDQNVLSEERPGGRHARQSPPARPAGAQEDATTLGESGIRMKESSQKWCVLFRCECLVYQLLGNCRQALHK